MPAIGGELEQLTALKAVFDRSSGGVSEPHVIDPLAARQHLLGRPRRRPVPRRLAARVRADAQQARPGAHRVGHRGHTPPRRLADQGRELSDPTFRPGPRLRSGRSTQPWPRRTRQGRTPWSLSYPSERFPGPPVIRLDIPEGWEAADSPTANITVFDTNSPDHFRVNLMVSVLTHGRPTPPSPRSPPDSPRRRAVATPDYEIVGERVADLNGREAVIRAQRVTPLGSPYPLFQAEVLLFGPEPRPDVQDLIQVHATCPGDMAEHYGAIFRTMVESLQVHRPVHENPLSVV